MTRCVECGADDATEELYIVAADYGRGAFLKVLCRPCDIKLMAEYTVDLEDAEIEEFYRKAWENMQSQLDSRADVDRP